MIPASVQHPRRHFRYSAFTLMELTIGLALMSILLVATASAVMVAAKAVPDERGRGANAASAYRALDMLSSELRYATAITVNTTTDIEFVVADRNGDGAQDKIRYTWSPDASGSGPLTRTLSCGDPSSGLFTAGTPVTIATNVRDFSLVYDRRAQQLTQTFSESSEMLLASNDPLLAITTADQRINSSTCCGQVITPSLPAAAVTWRVTRVRFKARYHGPAQGETKIQIRLVQNGFPTPVVLDQASMFESALGASYAWQQFSFANATGIPAGSSAALVMQWASDADSCDIQYQSVNATALNTNFVTSNNGGDSWTLGLTQDMLFYAYGTYSTADPAAYQYLLTNVRCRVRCGSDSSTRIDGSVRMLNEPHVNGP